MANKSLFLLDNSDGGTEIFTKIEVQILSLMNIIIDAFLKCAILRIHQTIYYLKWYVEKIYILKLQK